MKIVYRAANITEADIVAGMLRSRGIEAKVAGRHLQTAVGAAAVPYSSKILVNEQQYDEALAIVAEYESAQPESEPTARQGRPFAALGVFTKPVIFWISVFLLLVWFFISGPPVFNAKTWQSDIIFYDVAEPEGEWPDEPFEGRNTGN
ncbi:MAG: DUF2007 domain-containing protein [Thiolinea sp.]